MKLKLVAVEGNDGCDINAFLHFIQKHFDVNICTNYCPNPHSTYCEENKRLLKLSLRDPSRWTFTSLIKTIMDKHLYIKKFRQKKSSDDTTDFLFTNQSYLSDFECLSKTYHELKYMNNEEYTIIHNMLNLLKFPKYSYIIYIKSDPNKCYERLIESKHIVDFEYLQTLHQQYEQWIELMQKNTEYNILIIEYADIHNDEIIKDKILKRVKNYFKELPIRTQNNSSLFEDDIGWTVVGVKKKKKKK